MTLLVAKIQFFGLRNRHWFIHAYDCNHWDFLVGEKKNNFHLEKRARNRGRRWIRRLALYRQCLPFGSLRKE